MCPIVCWTLKGKSIAAYTRDQRIVTMTLDKLEEDKSFDFPAEDLNGNW